MFTKQFKTFLAEIGLGFTGSSEPLLEIKNTQGKVLQLVNNFSQSGVYPYSSTYTLATSITQRGVALGSSTTPPTEEDYKMGTYFTGSDISAAFNYQSLLDQDGNAMVKALITVTNKKAEPITVAEVGLQQQLSLRPYTGTYEWVVLFDHTLLDNPVTIAPNESAVIEYILKSIMS